MNRLARAALLFAVLTAPTLAAPVTPIVLREFIYTHAPFAQSHAATLVETSTGLVAAWFGGAHEGSADVGIWLARRGAQGWTAPLEVANGLQANGQREPCWNPVLFQPRSGPLMLFYKVGPDPRHWWGMRKTSVDGGQTWSNPERLPEGIIGPAKNKPVELVDGTILSPSSSERSGWKVFIERSSDRGSHWQRLGPLADTGEFSAIQPALLVWPSGRLQLLARSRQGRIVESESADAGSNWTLLKATALPNPNSGIDAVTLRDGRALLVYNPTHVRRSPLVVAISGDGEHWRDVLTLERGWGEYSYPAVIQTVDGLVHIAYTWKRERIRHVVIDPARLKG